MQARCTRCSTDFLGGPRGWPSTASNGGTSLRGARRAPLVPDGRASDSGANLRSLLTVEAAVRV